MRVAWVVACELVKEALHVLVCMLVPLCGGVPWFAEQHVELVGAVDEVVRVCPPSVRPDERQHGPLHANG